MINEVINPKTGKIIYEKDLEESYYKFNVLILFDRMNTDTEIGINETIPEYSGNNLQEESRYIYFQIKKRGLKENYYDKSLKIETTIKAVEQ